MYGKILANDPADPRTDYGLIRSLIEDHRSQEAYSKVAEALERFPQNASVQLVFGGFRQDNSSLVAISLAGMSDGMA